MTTELVVRALQNAVFTRKPSDKILFYSDQGIQYASNEYRNLLVNEGREQNMSRRSNYYDNAASESFFHTLKTELIHFENYESSEQVRLSIFMYIEVFYNRHRIHSSIGYKSPVQFEDEILT